MADDVIHANTKTGRSVMGCGAVRTRGVRVTGNIDLVTCKACLALYKPKAKKTTKKEEK